MADAPTVAAQIGVAVAAGLAWWQSRRAAKASEQAAPIAARAADHSEAALARLEGRLTGLAATVADLAHDTRIALRELTGGQARLEARIERAEAQRSEEPTRPDLPRPRQRLPSHRG